MQACEPPKISSVNESPFSSDQFDGFGMFEACTEVPNSTEQDIQDCPIAPITLYKEVGQLFEADGQDVNNRPAQPVLPSTDNQNNKPFSELHSADGQCFDSTVVEEHSAVSGMPNCENHIGPLSTLSLDVVEDVSNEMDFEIPFPLNNIPEFDMHDLQGKFPEHPEAVADTLLLESFELPCSFESFISGDADERTGTTTHDTSIDGMQHSGQDTKSILEIGSSHAEVICSEKTEELQKREATRQARRDRVEKRKRLRCGALKRGTKKSARGRKRGRRTNDAMTDRLVENEGISNEDRQETGPFDFSKSDLLG